MGEGKNRDSKLKFHKKYWKNKEKIGINREKRFLIKFGFMERKRMDIII